MHRRADAAAGIALAGALALPLLSGCAVVSVAGTAVSVGVGAVGLAADAAIGTARLTGKAVGAAVDAAGGGNDSSGISVRFREPTAADREKRRLAEQQAEEEDRRAAEARETKAP